MTREKDGMATMMEGFSDISIRNGFIRKVYFIVFLQILVSASFVSLFMLDDDVRAYTQEHPELAIMAMIGLFVFLLCLICCENLRREFPINIICLSIFTLLQAFILGIICSQYKPEIVITAFAITAVVCLSLTIFAFQTTIDFTVYSGTLLVLAVVFCLAPIVLYFVQIKIIHLMYCIGGVILFSGFLIFDTQLMMQGDHTYSISPEEYVFAALAIYLDIVNIFLMILRLLDMTRE